MHLEAARSIQHKKKAAEEQRQKAAEEQRQKAAEEQRQKAADEKKEKEEMEKKQKENASFQQREKKSRFCKRCWRPIFKSGQCQTWPISRTFFPRANFCSSDDSEHYRQPNRPHQQIAFSNCNSYESRGFRRVFSAIVNTQRQFHFISFKQSQLSTIKLYILQSEKIIVYLHWFLLLISYATLIEEDFRWHVSRHSAGNILFNSCIRCIRFTMIRLLCNV